MSFHPLEERKRPYQIQLINNLMFYQLDIISVINKYMNIMFTFKNEKFINTS
jgi:hypothetical protein